MAILAEPDVIAVLRDLMRDKGITLREVGTATGIPYRTIQNQMLGTSKLSAELFLALVDMLGAPLDLFLIANSDGQNGEWKHANALLVALSKALERLAQRHNATPAAGGDAG